ncbi:MAG: IS66 family transposase [Candidatus Omnitrophica bacterium]|nr:IS66 family transposase [Candidatus Omnitrophota bacterium]
MPLERQGVKRAGGGLEVSSGVLAAGLHRLAPYFKPLYECMLEKIAFEKLVHADETRASPPVKNTWLESFLPHQYAKLYPEDLVAVSLCPTCFSKAVLQKILVFITCLLGCLFFSSVHWYAGILVNGQVDD